MPFKGLTWDHPRGFTALDRAGRQSGLIAWDRQPLEGFESAPIADLCAAYDLVVLDHPHLGEALAQDCLCPLDEVFDPVALKRFAADSIGPSFRSYEMAGRAWALPLDAASQVMALRPEIADAPLATWAEVSDFARHEGGLALSLAGPHAALSLMSIAASLDDGLDLADGGWLGAALCVEAYEILSDLNAHANPDFGQANPIGLLEAMSSGTGIRICPLVYGYVPYAARPAPRTVLFRNAPRSRIGGRHGSILGGTGIGISRRCTPSDALRDHLAWLMSPGVQTGFIPENDGQPSNRAAWADPDVNAPVRGFYSATAATLEAAALRPRHDGYIAFQTAASAFLREALRTGLPPAAVAGRLADMFAASLPANRRV
ncbi:carbohydrate ABC transporter substrate-binding protein [Rhodobacteraceae bacterium KMS-5]|uniref:Carbohydrate ABC transporter substrate-binding protein n=1 Tax=Tabrizicola oligotrophica TaxID=2710650 RepID=A0A6M0QZC6_9RHOB|nr:carbohydrate ABC transporter substrate-binding protein [Tabrizicola oligotrophica]